MTASSAEDEHLCFAGLVDERELVMFALMTER